MRKETEDIFKQTKKKKTRSTEGGKTVRSEMKNSLDGIDSRLNCRRKG